MSDFATDDGSDYVLNVLNMAVRYGKYGRNVGHPIGVPARLVEQGQAEADRSGLDELASQSVILSHVLSDPGVEQALAKTCGGKLPAQMRTFYLNADALSEQQEMAAVAPARNDVKAAPRRL